jgi:UDP-N-acetylglucosamine diphosphorylase/glucosamine-1-phosphate N-acetyltransferase
MTRRLLLFEDRYWSRLRPLTDLLPVPALALGASDLARRWERATKLPWLGIEARADAMAAWRSAPVATPKAAPDDEILVVNAAVLPGPWLESALAQRAPSLFADADRPIAARVPFRMLAPCLGRGEEFEVALLGLGLPVFAAVAPALEWPWDLIAHNPDALAADLAGWPAIRDGDVHAQAVLIAPERISIAAGARIDPLAVLDARNGPISIERDAIVLSHTVVTGPCRVGEGTQLLGGFIGSSSIGPGCRIAGEVDACVWQGWSNKRHHGFVGHSVIGEWVNLGALTTTSDLKNNYGEVRMQTADGERATGSSKVGSILGSHVKTGIGTLLPTGAWIGTGSNLFGGGRFAPKHVPAFSWWDGERIIEHEFDRFLATARTAFGRRDRALLPPEETLLRSVHAAARRAHDASRAARTG